MTRIGSYASDQLNLYQVAQLHQALNQTQQQVTSGAKSQDYAGIASSASQLLNFTNQHDSITNFQDNNSLLGTTLSAMTTSYSGIQTSLSNFQTELTNFIATGKNTTQDFSQLQNDAFRSLNDMQFYLNSQVGGQYIFSGSAMNTPPMAMNYTTLADFQKAFDGYSVGVPTTRDANLSNVTTSVVDTGSLTFDDVKGTISSRLPGQFSNIASGSTITLSGGANSGQVYSVLANDGTSLTVSRNLTAEGVPGTPSKAAITTASGAAVATGPLEFTSPNTITGTKLAGAQTLPPVAAVSGASDQLVNLVTPTGASLGIQNGDTFVMTPPGNTFTVSTSRAPAAYVLGNGQGSSIADLTNWVSQQTAGNVTFSMTAGNATLTSQAANAAQINLSGNVATVLGFTGGATAVGPGANTTIGSVTANVLALKANTITNNQYLTALTDSSGNLLGIKDGDTLTATNGVTTSTFTVGGPTNSGTPNGSGSTLADLNAWLQNQPLGSAANNNLSMTIGAGGHGVLAVNNNDATADVTFGGNLSAILGFTTAGHQSAANGIPMTNVNATIPNPGVFQSLNVGDSFTVSGAANAANNGAFIVAGKDLTNGSLVIKRATFTSPANLTTAAADGTALISVNGTSYGATGNINTGSFTFQNPDTISVAVPANAGTLQTIPVGGLITIANAANPANDGSYVVTGNDGSNLTVAATTQTSLTNEAANAAATVSNGSTTAINPGTLAFYAQGSTMIAGAGGSLANLQVGQSLNVSGTAFNNGSLQVTKTFDTAVTSESETPTLTAGNDAQALVQVNNTTYGPSGAVNPVGANWTITAPNTLTAAAGGSLAGIAVGSRITISNAATPGNDGSYVVLANTGTNLTLGMPTQLVVNSSSALSPSRPIAFNTAGAVSDLIGSPADLGKLKAGDVITASGTLSNNGDFVVSGPPSTVTDENPGAATVTFNGGGATTAAFFSKTNVISAGAIFPALANGQTLTIAGSASNNGIQTVDQVFNDAVSTEAVAAGTISLSQNSASTPMSTTGSFTFTAAPASTLTSSNSLDFANVSAGDTITVGGNGPSNNLGMQFVVTGVTNNANGSATLTLALPGFAARVQTNVPLAQPNTAVEVAKNISASTSSYYQGNGTAVSQQVDTNQTMTFGVTGMNPAFEKAVRALQLIAQGTLGTAGGLDLNKSRLTTASSLLASAINQGTKTPSGEQAGSLMDLVSTVSIQQGNLKDIGTQQTNYLNFVDQTTTSLQNADQTTTIENLVNQQQALQAAYQAMASVRQLSLLTYLK